MLKFSLWATLLQLATFLVLEHRNVCIAQLLLLQTMMKYITSNNNNLFQLAIHWPDARTLSWVCGSHYLYSTAANSVEKYGSNPSETYSLAWWRKLEIVALFHHCCRTGWDIGNPLATDKLLAWWRNQEMVTLLNHCCRTGWVEYWQPSCNWFITCLVAVPGDGCVVPPLLQDR